MSKSRAVSIPDPVQVIDPETGIISWYGVQAPRFYKGWQQHRTWLAHHTGSASTPCREGYEELPQDGWANC